MIFKKLVLILSFLPILILASEEAPSKQSQTEPNTSQIANNEAIAPAENNQDPDSYLGPDVEIDPRIKFYMKNFKLDLDFFSRES